MMDHNFQEWEMEIRSLRKSFGNKLRKEEDVQEWRINKKILNIRNSSLMNLMISLISLIKALMLREMIQRGQMLNLI